MSTHVIHLGVGSNYACFHGRANDREGLCPYTLVKMKTNNLTIFIKYTLEMLICSRNNLVLYGYCCFIELYVFMSLFF